MISIVTTLLNFSYIQLLNFLFKDNQISYYFSEKGILRYLENPICEGCKSVMKLNGYNTVTKRNIASIKVGKYVCPSCGNIHHTDINFWIEQKSLISQVMGKLLIYLKNGGCGFRRMEAISQFILPFGKTSLFNQFKKIVEFTEYKSPEHIGKLIILNFDEQYIKICGKWRYRLTLLNYKTRLPIAEKVVKKLTNEVIMNFIKSNFDPTPYDIIYVVTDLKPSYKEIFKSLYGEKLIHQYCLFHLYQLILDEFPKTSSLSELLLQYRLLNIFYNYDEEIVHLENLVYEEKNIAEKDKKDLKSWTKAKKEELYAYFAGFRTDNSNPLRDPIEAYCQLLKVFECYEEMPSNIQKRINMINGSILNFLAYRTIPEAPSTNNAIEGYFSKTINPILKRQMKTIKGAENSIKSYAIERLEKYQNKNDLNLNSKPISLIELILPLRLLGAPI